MSHFIEYSNNIFDVTLTVWRNVKRRDKRETLNEETRCNKCVHPFFAYYSNIT